MITRELRAFFTAILLLAWPAASNAALSAVSPTLDPTGNYPLWYQDSGGLKLELCNFADPFCLGPPVPVVPFGVDAETFYWTADVRDLALADGGVVNAVFAMEATFTTGAPTAGEQMTFGRTRLFINAQTVGHYEIVHPFGTFEADVTVIDPGAIEVRDTVDIGCAASPCNFAAALGIGIPGSIGPFLYWDAGLPQVGVGGASYLGDAATPHTFFGSPTGNNFLRVYRDGVLVGETHEFVISGRVFTGAGNTAPVAVADAGPFMTGIGRPLTINVLANDTAANVPINPTTLVASASANGGVVTKTAVGSSYHLTYTPPAGFSGTDTFTYTAQSFTGLTSAPATVTVFVENLELTLAEMHGKVLKWSLRGASTDTTANSIDIHLGSSVTAQGMPNGPLLAQHVPVQADGTFFFVGKSLVSFAGQRTVSIVSANGIAIIGAPLAVR
ncbi:MAG: Ig-like domain-containing protein [Deltaproteobacteria bacterium]|nr:Ig-like domain-containing protein [Deltaproteobacteria bacterium]